MPLKRQFVAKPMSWQEIVVTFTMYDGSVWGQVPLSGCTLKVTHLWLGLGGFEIDCPADIWRSIAKNSNAKKARPAGYIVSFHGAIQSTGRILEQREEWSTSRGKRIVYVGVQDNVLLRDILMLPRDTVGGPTIGTAAQILTNTIWDNMVGNSVSPRDARDLLGFTKTSYPIGNFAEDDKWGPEREWWLKPQEGMKFVQAICSRWEQLSLECEWKTQASGKGQVYVAIRKPVDRRETVFWSTNALNVSSYRRTNRPPKANSILVSKGDPNDYVYYRNPNDYQTSKWWGRRHIDMTSVERPGDKVDKSKWAEIGRQKLEEHNEVALDTIEFDANTLVVNRRNKEFRDGDIVTVYEPGVFYFPGYAAGFSLGLSQGKLSLQYRVRELRE